MEIINIVWQVVWVFHGVIMMVGVQVVTVEGDYHGQVIVVIIVIHLQQLVQDLVGDFHHNHPIMFYHGL
jgi:hypothetical protein